jgi:hypothetical protein
LLTPASLCSSYPPKGSGGTGGNGGGIGSFSTLSIGGGPSGSWVPHGMVTARYHSPDSQDVLNSDVWPDWRAWDSLGWGCHRQRPVAPPSDMPVSSTVPCGLR